MFTSAQNQMCKAITDSDMVGVQVSLELTEAAIENWKHLLSIGKKKIKIKFVLILVERGR